MKALKQLKQLEAKHELEIKKLERELDIEKWLLENLGLDYDVKVFDTFISFKNILKNTETLDIVNKLRPYMTPMYLKDPAKGLAGGYSGIYGKRGCIEPIAGLRVDYRNAESSSNNVLKLYCNIKGEILDIWIDLNETKGYASVRVEYEDEAKLTAVYKNRLHSFLKDIDCCVVQEFGTHTYKLRQYTIWFDCSNEELNLKEIVENI